SARRNQGFGGTPMALNDEHEPGADDERSEANEDPTVEATAGSETEGAAGASEAPAPPRTPDAGARAAATAERARGAPGWIVPAYVAGLLLLYIGERILQASPTWRTVAVSAGMAALLVATAARFVPSFRSGGERRDIERLLSILSVTGLVALA